MYNGEMAYRKTSPLTPLRNRRITEARQRLALAQSHLHEAEQNLATHLKEANRDEHVPWSKLHEPAGFAHPVVASEWVARKLKKAVAAQ